MDRRDFLKTGVCVAGALGAAGVIGCRSGAEGTAGTPPPVAGTPPAAGAASFGTAGALAGRVGKNRVFERPPTDVHMAVAANREPAELVKAAVQAYGGPDAIFRRGDTVVIKPNLAWSREPETGANTSPAVLRAVIQLARDAGAGEILVVEHSCDSSQITFDLSGGKQACEAMGVSLISLDNPSLFEEQTIARGVTIKSDQLARDILECDVYINLPCLKHHGATDVSLAMKNQMGTNLDRQRYHRDGGQQAQSLNLHQNIADLATALRPTLVIVDATRALTTNGPKGPGAVKETRTIIVTHDMVAADALGAQMLGFRAENVPHIRLAGQAGVGSQDLTKLKIARV